MRTFIVGDDTKQQAIGDKLLLANLSRIKSEAALKALQALNPHADLARLAPGTVLFVPDTPGFKLSASASTVDAPFAVLQGLLETSLKIALAATETENRRRTAEQADFASAFENGALKRLAEVDAATGKNVKLRIAALQKSFAADRRQGVQAENDIAAIGKAALDKLADLKKQIG